MHCRDATSGSFVAKFRREVIAHFHVVAVKVCGIDCMACQDEFFVKNPANVKEDDEHALDFSLHFLLGSL
jgi:hypothetical protein